MILVSGGLFHPVFPKDICSGKLGYEHEEQQEAVFGDSLLQPAPPVVVATVGCGYREASCCSPSVLLFPVLSNVGTIPEMLNYKHNCMLGTLTFRRLSWKPSCICKRYIVSHSITEHSVAVFGGFIVGSVACLVERGIGIPT